MLGRDEQRRILLFTSAVPSEGKSFSCLNFAFCQAQQGKKTLLIDLDLRRPAVARYMNMQMDAPGVTDYLLGKAKLKDLVQPSADPNVFILTAGPKVPNPAEQLAGPWVGQLLKEAAEMFDVVIVDTAPLNAVSDTMYLLKYAQAIFMVIRSGKTPAPGIKRALEHIRRGNAKVAGVVLNYLPQSGGYGYYYYYQHKGGYYSKGVYGATDDMK
jgi:polysaccharide biosynthesis transport protein